MIASWMHSSYNIYRKKEQRNAITVKKLGIRYHFLSKSYIGHYIDINIICITKIYISKRERGKLNIYHSNAIHISEEI